MNTKLTERERQISDLVLFGLTDKGIASHLGISPWTVRSHLRRIFAKVGVCSRVELAALTASQLTNGEEKVPVQLTSQKS